jgi:hypothetical protein
MKLPPIFISKLSDNLQKEINYFRVDLIKPSSIVLPAYGDSQGLQLILI